MIIIIIGYLQARGIDDKIAKQETAQKYFARLKCLLRTKLSARNMSTAINTYATSVLTYSFGVLRWTDTDLDKIDIQTRTMFTRHRAHHPRSAIERFHLPRREGGRGVPSARIRHYAQVQNLREYFLERAQGSRLHRAIVVSDMCTPLRLNDGEYDPSMRVPGVEGLKQKWKAKPLHGKYITTLDRTDIDATASQSWLCTGNIFTETEGFIAAIQDQVIMTRAYKKRILGENIGNIKCRMCGEKEETLDHLMAGCSVMAPKAYLDRHNRIAKIVHQSLRSRFLEETDNSPYYSYEPPQVCENEAARLYWNRKIVTDKPIPNNIPDIVLTIKHQRVTYIIDIAVPLAANTAKTYAEKINKYLPLADEIRDMWDMDKVIIVPIVIGATGEIPLKLCESTNILQLERNIYLRIQKSALLDTCSIIRRVLGEQYEAK